MLNSSERILKLYEPLLISLQLRPICPFFLLFNIKRNREFIDVRIILWCIHVYNVYIYIYISKLYKLIVIKVI